MGSSDPSGSEEQPTIAVLPFETQDRDSSYPFLGEAIAEEVITTLSRVPQLRVIARGSSFQYKDSVPDVRVVAQSLGVRYLAQGSVRVAADRVRVTAHLSDAERREEIWSDRYDRALDDVFAVQDDIATEIATALEVKIGFGDQVREWRSRGTSLAAYEHFANSLHEYLKFSRNANRRARREAQAALDLDPGFTSAHVALGSTHATDAHLGWTESRQKSLRLAREAVQAAFDVVPNLPEGNALLGRIYMLEGDYDEAIRTTGHALEDQPSYALGYHLQAMNLLYAGRFLEAVEADRQVFLLSPLSDIHSDNARLYLAAAYCQLGKHDMALEELGRVVTHRPKWVAARAIRVVAHMGRGDTEAARREGRRILEMMPHFSTTWWASLHPYKNSSDLDVMVRPLLAAGLPENPGESELQGMTGPEPPATGRALATVLFTDIVGSTQLAAKMGDNRWRDTIDAHDELASATVQSTNGRFIKSTGDGILAVFDRPGDAIGCAQDLGAKCDELGIRIRAGIHTGEIELRGSDVAGIAVHMAARVAAQAGAAEILVTRTVKELVIGADLRFASRGTTELRGVPGEQELFSVLA